MKRMNQRIWIVSLLMIFTFIMPTAAATGESLIEQIAREEFAFRRSIFDKQVKVSTMKIVRGNLQKFSSGTGVIVGRESQNDKEIFYIITAIHVLGQDEKMFNNLSIQIFFPTKEIFAISSSSRYPAEILFFNWFLEYVFLKVEVLKSDVNNLDVKVAAISQETPLPLEEFWVSGFYQGKYLVANKAYLSYMVTQESGHFNGTPFIVYNNLYLIANGVNGPGMSGGGVFNTKGDLIGLVWAVNDNSNIVNAVSAVFIQRDFTEKLKSLLESGQQK